MLPGLKELNNVLMKKLKNVFKYISGLYLFRKLIRLI
jgi:hypothetical protein